MDVFEQDKQGNRQRQVDKQIAKTKDRHPDKQTYIIQTYNHSLT